jgi:hypothetical protein
VQMRFGAMQQWMHATGIVTGPLTPVQNSTRLHEATVPTSRCCCIAVLVDALAPKGQELQLHHRLKRWTAPMQSCCTVTFFGGTQCPTQCHRHALRTTGGCSGRGSGVGVVSSVTPRNWVRPCLHTPLLVKPSFRPMLHRVVARGSSSDMLVSGVLL